MWNLLVCPAHPIGFASQRLIRDLGIVCNAPMQQSFGISMPSIPTLSQICSLHTTQPPILRLQSLLPIPNLPSLATNCCSRIKYAPWIPLLLNGKQLRVVICAVEVILPVWLLDISFVEVDSTSRRIGSDVTPWLHYVEGEVVRGVLQLRRRRIFRNPVRCDEKGLRVSSGFVDRIIYVQWIARCHVVAYDTATGHYGVFYSPEKCIEFLRS